MNLVKVTVARTEDKAKPYRITQTFDNRSTINFDWSLQELIVKGDALSQFFDDAAKVIYRQANSSSTFNTNNHIISTYGFYGYYDVDPAEKPAQFSNISAAVNNRRSTP